MSFYYSSPRQPEILRTVQKDATYTNHLAHELSNVLRFTSKTLWIKYNGLCGLLMELAYHAFASCNNLQTLGEEYTGIIQIDGKYIALPSKLLQIVSIIMEHAGDQLFVKLIQNVDAELGCNPDIRPEAKLQLRRCFSFMLHAIPYIQAIHRTWFYLCGGKYQISRRLSGINYVLIRHWLNIRHSVYGYKILGTISALQLMLVFTALIKEAWRSNQFTQASIQNVDRLRTRLSADLELRADMTPKCTLCLGNRRNTSVTLCGHLFCWSCILDWLDQKEECPVCRELIKKSTVVCMMNFS